MAGSGPRELRRGVLAVQVLDDVDVTPADDGVVLPGEPLLHVPWSECRSALLDRSPDGPEGRLRLASWLRARRWAADAGAGLPQRVRPVGLPADHALHPGPDWVRQRVLGGALDLGLGAVGLDPADPDGVVLLPPPALRDAGLDAPAAWTTARALLERRGEVAAQLLARDGRGRLRPVGDCDVVTLLGAASLRRALAERAGGLAAAVVPMRTRGWTDLTLIDPAFGPAAATATAPAERGFARPLLVTADEVRMVPAGGHPERGVVAVPWPRTAL